MVGRNEMRLNGATMTKAIQHYFDTVLFRDNESPTVSYVQYNGSEGGSFIVKLDERKEPTNETD